MGYSWEGSKFFIGTIGQFNNIKKFIDLSRRETFVLKTYMKINVFLPLRQGKSVPVTLIFQLFIVYIFI